MVTCPLDFPFMTAAWRAQSKFRVALRSPFSAALVFDRDATTLLSKDLL